MNPRKQIPRGLDAGQPSGGAGKDGEIFAAFLDADSNKVDVWRSPNHDGQFTKLPNPFPEDIMCSHPRIRVNIQNGDLYVAAKNCSSFILINRFDNGAWGQFKAASNPAVIYPKIILSDREVRTGPQFSFDVGDASQNGGDEIRFVYTMRDQKTGLLHLRGSFCRRKLDSLCKDAPEWGTTPVKGSGDRFNPIVHLWRGFFNIPPIWKVSFLSRQDDPQGNTISVRQGNLVVFPNGARFFLPFKLIKGHTPCPDLRGYWGDYDDLQRANITAEGQVEFIRAFSDSRQGCTKRWKHTSHHLHVSAVVFK